MLGVSVVVLVRAELYEQDMAILSRRRVSGCALSNIEFLSTQSSSMVLQFSDLSDGALVTNISI